MIELKDISKSFDGGQSYVVRNLSLSIGKGETVVLLGSSGCGKTTTLKMINRLLDPSRGRIEIDGQDTAEINKVELRRSIGYVFQGIGLLPHMTVEENVAIVLGLLKIPRPIRRERAHELMALVGLEPGRFQDRYPDELSGGQQQRVGVARALATDPAFLLMDEPFGALDAVTRDSLQGEVLRLKESLDKTIIFVTHDIFEALTLADRIAVMHDGNLEQIGTASDILANPATVFVEKLFQKPATQLTAFQQHLK